MTPSRFRIFFGRQGHGYDCHFMTNGQKVKSKASKEGQYMWLPVQKYLKKSIQGVEKANKQRALSEIFVNLSIFVREYKKTSKY